MISEKEKFWQGKLYDANNDAELIAERQTCKVLCHEYNHLLPSETKRREEIIVSLFGKTGHSFLIEQPFFCNYGYNIEIGESFMPMRTVLFWTKPKLTLMIMCSLLQVVGFILRDILLMWSKEIMGLNMHDRLA